MCISRVVTRPMGPFSVELPHDALAPMANRRDTLKKNWRHAKKIHTSNK
jgi:hypothetical protein